MWECSRVEGNHEIVVGEAPMSPALVASLWAAFGSASGGVGLCGNKARFRGAATNVRSGFGNRSFQVRRADGEVAPIADLAPDEMAGTPRPVKSRLQPALR